MHRQATARLLRTISQQIVRAATLVDIIDVGGGFPSMYPGREPPALECYIDEIRAAFDRMAVGYACQLWCEPGRALVAEAESVIVKVDAPPRQTRFTSTTAPSARSTTRLIANGCSRRRPFGAGKSPGLQSVKHRSGFYGPTCDSADYLPGPFMLPTGIGEGDYIEIGNIGAYGRVMAGHFNGYGYYNEAILKDEPMLSMYAGQSDEEVISAAV